jgi:hypothetical protein
VHIKRLQETSVLAGVRLFDPLPNDVVALINKTINQQGKLIKQGVLSSPSKNPGTNPAMGGQSRNSGRRVAQTRQTVSDSTRTPERNAKWYDYRPPW